MNFSNASRYNKQFDDKTYGEILENRTLKNDRFLKSQNLDPNNLITIDQIRNKRMTVRKWRMLKAIQKART